MRKLSIVILTIAILVSVLFVVFHTQRYAQSSITGIGVLAGAG